MFDYNGRAPFVSRTTHPVFVCLFSTDPTLPSNLCYTVLMAGLNFDDLFSKNPKVKYACTKRAIALSTEDPEALYSRIDTIINMLDSENRIFTWTATIVLGNLSAIDTEHKVDAVVPKLFALFHSDSLITSANAIKALFLDAKHKPDYTDKIVDELLAVEHMNYIQKKEVSPECRNVATAQVLDGLMMLGEEVCMRKQVLAFVARQKGNSRPSVVKKAHEILKSCGL